MLCQKEFHKLLDYSIGDFSIFKGKYPSIFDNISELSQESLELFRKKINPDTSQTKVNKERKDHTKELIDRNEKEADLLLKDYYLSEELKNKNLKGVKDKIVLTREFLLDIDADAIVNAANECLLGGGGLDQIIHTFAGESLKQETKLLPNVTNDNYGDFHIKCLTGDAKITSGHNLKMKYIIHGVTPYLDFDGNPDRKNHVKVYKSALNYVDGKNIRSIIIPSLSTGYYGYPMLEATLLALLTVREFLLKYPNNVDKIIFCVDNEILYEIYQYLILILFKDELF